jgi:hypothetical protein
MKVFLFFLHGLHVLHGVCLSVASRCGVWKGLGWGVKCVRREGAFQFWGEYSKGSIPSTSLRTRPE